MSVRVCLCSDDKEATAKPDCCGVSTALVVSTLYQPVRLKITINSKVAKYRKGTAILFCNIQKSPNIVPDS